ncbi:MAG: DMT family transporter [Burkholderiaceae bacterium]|nr:DMT family transporter [Rhodoferax sp.]
MPASTDIDNRKGIVAMSLAMGLFIANDALVKYVSATLPAAQLIFIRGLFATGLLLAAAVAMGALRPGTLLRDGAWTQLTQRPVLLRAALDALATMAYLTSLFHLPIGNASAINMASPMFIAVYAAVVWRERVGPARWLAIAGGFIGVLLIVQPAAEAFNAWSLMCLFATLLHTGRDLITRRIALTVPSILITLTTSIAVLLLTGPWSLVQGWQPVDGSQLALLAGASVFLSSAYYMVIVGMRTGELSLVAPFRYTALIYALALGWLVWGDVPNLLAWSGIVLMVAAGIFMLRAGRSR